MFDSERNLTPLGYALVCLLLLLAGLAFYAILTSSDKPAPGYIAVVGVGEASAIPSEMRLSLTVTERAADSATASQAQLGKVASLVGMIQGEFGGQVKFTSNTVSLTRFDNSRRFQEEGELVKGYEASQTLTFVFQDRDKAAAFYPRLTRETDGITSAISFQFASTNALYEKARSLAVKAARRRAETYAKEAGAKLGAVQIVEESGANNQRIPFDLYDRVTGHYRQASNGQLEEVALRSALTQDKVTPTRLILAPDAQSVTVKIYARFTLN